MTIEEFIAIEELKQLRSQYSHFYDGNQLEELVGLFTDDAVCQWDEAHGGYWIGKEEIRRNYERCFREFNNLKWIVMHCVTNPLIELTSQETAKGRWFMLDFNFCGLTQDPLGCIGIYDDLYQKEEGVWRIKRTRLDFLYPDRRITGETDAADITGKAQVFK